MSRSEIVSRFVAAIASNPSHSNETVPNIVDMAEELADEVEKRPGLNAGITSTKNKSKNMKTFHIVWMIGRTLCTGKDYPGETLEDALIKFRTEHLEADCPVGILQKNDTKEATTELQQD